MMMMMMMMMMMNRTWESIRESIKASDTESLGYYKWKQHKP
jgi:hypothetical protein